jgi:hypothetical protein
MGNQAASLSLGTRVDLNAVGLVIPAGRTAAGLGILAEEEAEEKE